MTEMSDLSWELVEEILLRVPITSLGAVRSTCKRWNALSKDRYLCKEEAKHQFLGFMIKNSKLCSLRFDFHSILKEDGHEEFAYPSMKEISNPFNQAKISQVLLCDGLLLLSMTRDNITSLMVWNPYLGQTRWIKPRTVYYVSDTYALGYDKNRNHKILRYLYHYNHKCDNKHEIYDFKSDSWRVLDVTPASKIGLHQSSASLKGNTYFLVIHINMDEYYDEYTGSFLCFDFTTERFGEVFPLPRRSAFSHSPLCSRREEKLAALCMNGPMAEVWVTTKIEPNEVSWSNFLTIDLEPVPGYNFFSEDSSFFIDEEKKLAVVFRFNRAAYIIGENELWETRKSLGENQLVCSNSYVPSLVHIKQNCTRQKEREEEEAIQQD